MNQPSALASRPPLNGIRIAGTSAAIALHAIVLMLLFAPATWAPSKVEVPQDTPVLPDFPVTPVVISDPPPTARHDHPKPAVVAPASKPAVAQDEAVIADNNALVDPVTIGPPDVGPGDPPSGAVAELTTDRAPTPPYPLVALRAGTTGTVMLRINIDAQGHPVSGSIEKSSGSRLLDQSALKYVLANWHFVPAMRAGSAVNAVALVPIEFALD